MSSRNEVTRFFVRLSSLVFALLITFVVSVIIHENSHKEAMAVLGGKGEITYIYLSTLLSPLVDLPFFRIPIAGSVSFVEGFPLPDRLWIVYLMGGMGAALVPWAILWFIAFRTFEKGDAWVEAISASLMLTHGLYAPTEVVLYYMGKDIGAIAMYTSIAVSQIAFYVIYTRGLAHWLTAHIGPGEAREKWCTENCACSHKRGGG